MSQKLGVFDLILPGIVAGMILAAVALELGDAVFHDAFSKAFPTQTFIVLAVGIGMASGIGLASVFLHFRGSEESSKHQITSSNPIDKKSSRRNP
jgi:hypothetical protein